MHILVLTWNFPPVVGGIEYLVGHVSHGLMDRGNEVTVVTAHHKSSDEGPRSAGRIFRANRPGLKAFLAFACWRGWREISERRPAVLLVGSLAAAPAALLLAKIRRIPFVMIVYGSDLVIGGALYQLFLRITLRAAARIIAISHHTARLAVAKGAHHEQIRIIPPGVEVADGFEGNSGPVSGKWDDLFRGRRLLLSVGRLIKRKGVLEFIRDVMPSLTVRHPEILFVVVGEDAGKSLIHKERMSESIKAMIQEKNLSNHVLLLGRLSDEDLMKLFGRASLFIMPGLDLPDDIEGFGIVQTEAGLRGVPSVSTRVGGVPDAVEDGVTGLLVPPGDAEAMERAISALLADEAWRVRMGQAAARRAKELFAWPVISARYETLMAELTGNGDRKH